MPIFPLPDESYDPGKRPQPPASLTTGCIYAGYERETGAVVMTIGDRAGKAKGSESYEFDSIEQFESYLSRATGDPQLADLASTTMSNFRVIVVVVDTEVVQWIPPEEIRKQESLIRKGRSPYSEFNPFAKRDLDTFPLS